VGERLVLDGYSLLGLLITMLLDLHDHGLAVRNQQSLSSATFFEEHERVCGILSAQMGKGGR
jgi:hypothetical protein